MKITPADRRKQLFGAIPRPVILPASYEDLYKWVRTGYEMAGNSMTDLEYQRHFNEYFTGYDEFHMVSDHHPMFRAGQGPMAVVGVKRYGETTEPHAVWFPWATARNHLRCAVQYMMAFRRKGVGVMRVLSLPETNNFHRRLTRYVPLYFVGKVPKGDRFGRGDEYIYYIVGKGKKAEVSAEQQPIERVA